MFSYFLQANTENTLVVRETGKRRRVVGFVVPAKFTSFTPELRNAKILKKESSGLASKYKHFDWKNIVIIEIRLAMMLYTRIGVVF